MSGSPGTRFVVDASVVIKLFADEPLSDVADALFARFARERDMHFWVPDFFFVECANILWKHVRQSKISEAKAERCLRRLVEMELHAVAAEQIVVDALSLAMRYDISAYDASYVAVARLVDAPLVTADERLVRKVGEHEPALLLAELASDS